MHSSVRSYSPQVTIKSPREQIYEAVIPVLLLTVFSHCCFNIFMQHLSCYKTTTAKKIENSFASTLISCFAMGSKMLKIKGID